MFLVNRGFGPLPKRGRFDENGENNENGGCHSGKGMV